MKFSATLAVLLSFAVTASAQDTAPASQLATPIDPYVVGQAKPPAQPGQRLLDLTLTQAIDLALEKNLDLKVARMDPQKIDYSLRSARAAFMPRYSSTYSYNN